MKPKITVLTTVYNGLPYLKEAVESTLNQTYSNFEFLIIDDASTDESVECICSYPDPRIRLVQNELNMGQTASLNKGLQLAQGEFIARLDQDDVNLPSRLKEQVEFLETHPEITIVSSWEHSIDSSGKIFRDWKASLKNYGEFLGLILLRLCPIWHPSVMFRKDAIIKLGGFDVSYGPAEDYELWGRMALKRLNASFVPRFHLLQRVHGQRQSCLKKDLQIASTKKAHLKMIVHFLNNHQECVAALLSLEKDPCSHKNDKKHFREITRNLEELFLNIKTKQNLSDEEFKSLKKRIYRRLGLGVYFARILTLLPSKIFRVFFYALSPVYITRLRAFLSEMYNSFFQLRYKKP